MAGALKQAYWRVRRTIDYHLSLAGAESSDTRMGRLASDLDLASRTSPAAKLAQIQLAHDWRNLPLQGLPLPRFADVEFRAFSQNGEDGILLYLFSLIGTTSRTCVEICAGDGIQCNAANLILNHGWTALLVDGDAGKVKRGQDFYAAHPDTFSFPPQFVHAWIDRETVDALIAGQGFAGEIDLLSIDLDGVDYWIWDAIESVRPRVVVAETQCIWGASRSVTVPYCRDFHSPLIKGFGVYSGASLPAFVSLAERKGYRLVGSQALGFNAFFVRNDVGVGLLPEVSAASCLDRPFVHWAMRELLPLVQDKDWVEV